MISKMCKLAICAGVLHVAMFASTITNATYSVSAGGGNCGSNEACSSGSGAAGLVTEPVVGEGPFSGSAQASTSGLPAPNVSASIQLSVNPNLPSQGPLGGTASAFLTYYLELIPTVADAPAGPIPVDVSGLIVTNYQVTGNAPYGTGNLLEGGPVDQVTNSADILIQNIDGNSSTLELSLASNQGNPAGVEATNLNQSFNDTIFMNPSLETQVNLSADVSANIGYWLSPVTLSSTATIDPVFTIAPQYASDFELVLSDGIGNSPAAVPEPGSRLPVAAALVLLAALSRLRSIRKPREL